MPEALSITKPNTVETFMKANTDRRITTDVKAAIMAITGSPYDLSMLIKNW